MGLFTYDLDTQAADRVAAALIRRSRDGAVPWLATSAAGPLARSAAAQRQSGGSDGFHCAGGSGGAPSAVPVGHGHGSGDGAAARRLAPLRQSVMARASDLAGALHTDVEPVAPTSIPDIQGGTQATPDTGRGGSWAAAAMSTSPGCGGAPLLPLSGAAARARASVVRMAPPPPPEPGAASLAAVCARCHGGIGTARRAGGCVVGGAGGGCQEDAPAAGDSADLLIGAGGGGPGGDDDWADNPLLTETWGLDPGFKAAWDAAMAVGRAWGALCGTSVQIESIRPGAKTSM
jgi:hypothetical protein